MRRTLCLLPCLLAASTLLAHADTVSFDYLGAPDDRSLPFTLSSGSLQATFNAVTFDSYPVYDVTPGELLYFGDSPLTISFSAELTDLSFGIFGFDPNQTFTFQLLRNGTLVGAQYGTFNIEAGYNGTSFGAVDLTGNFDSIRLVSAYTYSYEGFQTLTATTATPEPASLLLLGTGALGAVGIVRRRLAW